MRLDSVLGKSRSQYISAQKKSTLFDALDELNKTFNENGDCVCNKKNEYHHKRETFSNLNFYNMKPMFVDISDTTVPNLIYV
jgi:hypothetical protein